MNINDIGNFIHYCEEEKANINKSKKGLEYTKLSKEKIASIYSFYLDFAESKYQFKKYNWQGMDEQKGLNKLEGLLLRCSGMQSFCIIKYSTISDTLKKMDLGEKLCISHPRSVIKHDVKEIVYTEDEKIKIKTKESRMECLLRHIRNSLAHNQIYVFGNDMILLEDKNEKDIITARILIRSETLYEWIKIIKNEK